MRSRFLYICVFLFGGLIHGASQNAELFEKGKEAYKDGEYQEAVDSWTEVLNSGNHSSALYYNLGNAHYRLNQIGPSIYFYEKALQLDPGDTDIKNNLAFAENARIDIIEPLPKTIFSRWYEQGSKLLTYEGWAVGAVILSSLAVLLFLLYYFSTSERKKRLLFVSSMISGAMMLFFVVMAFMLYSDAVKDRPAIVFAESTEVRNEPTLQGEAIFILHEGTKVQVLDDDGDWLRIRLVDGKDGWILESDLREL